MLFDRFKSYGFVHHRSLNSCRGLREGLRLATAHPERTHILEGDLCWDFSDGRELLYFRHPDWVVDTLAPAAVEAGLANGSLIGLDALASIKATNAFLVVELKVGRGDVRAALRHLVAHLEAHFAARYWIDGFSLRLLRLVKSLSPRTTVTLHTECVVGGRVVVGAPEMPPLRIVQIADLDGIDGIAIRRRGGERFMRRACEDVHKAGKALILSRLHTLRHFECSEAWGARVGYMHWPFEELLAFHDRQQARNAGLR